jgi:hypothetical protein
MENGLVSANELDKIREQRGEYALFSRYSSISVKRILSLRMSSSENSRCTLSSVSMVRVGTSIW